MFLLEGADLVGKTTLAKRAVELLPHWIYGHLTRLPDTWDPVIDYCTIINTNSGRIVQDRFHISEMAYCKLNNRSQPMFSPSQFDTINNNFVARGGFTLFITADDCVIESRWRDGEMFTLPQVLSVNRWYLENVMKYADHHIHITRNNPEISDSELKFVIERYEERYYDKFNDWIKGVKKTWSFHPTR